MLCFSSEGFCSSCQGWLKLGHFAASQKPRTRLSQPMRALCQGSPLSCSFLPLLKPASHGAWCIWSSLRSTARARKGLGKPSCMFYELYSGVLKWSGIPKCYLRTPVIKKLKFINSADILLGKALMTPWGAFFYETQWHFKCFSIFNHIEHSTKWKPPWNGWISENFMCFWMSARCPCCLL